MATPDLYEVLGVSRGASAAAIKAAFHNKAKEQHPDPGGDPEAFRLLKMAYDVLSNAASRRHYDRTGETPADIALRAADEARFRTLVGDVLVATVAQAGAAPFTDMIDLMQKSVAQQIRNADAQIAALKRMAQKLAEVDQRIRSSDTENTLRAVIGQRLGDIDNNIIVILQQRDLYERLRMLLEQYGYDVQVESIP